MKRIWNLDGVSVHLTGVNTGHDPSFEGFIVAGKTVGIWQASIKSGGYVVEYARLDGVSRGVYHGVTFNLGLEVAKGLTYSQLGYSPKSEQKDRYVIYKCERCTFCELKFYGKTEEEAKELLAEHMGEIHFS